MLLHIDMGHLPINFTINILLVSLLSLMVQANAAELSSVNSVIGEGYLRTTIITQDNTKYRLFRLTNPHRLVIYLQNTALTDIPGTEFLLPSPLKQLRHGTHNDKNLQLIFDLDEPLTYEAGSFYDAAENRLKLTVTLKSPNFQPSPQAAAIKTLAKITPPKPVAKKITNKDIPPQILALVKADKDNPIQFDSSHSENSSEAINLPIMNSAGYPKQPTNTQPQKVNNKKKLSTLINKLKKYSHVDLQSYGTFGIQSYPKKATKNSSRVDLGYTSNIGSVDFGIGVAKPVFFVSTKIKDADIKLLVEEEGGSSKPAAKLGVAMEW